LFELSIVTRPAYDEATVEARNWSPSPASISRPSPGWRWRP
jgi:uncharacterized protein